MTNKSTTPTQPQCRTCAHYTGFACTNRKSCMYNVLVGGKGFCGEWEGKSDEQKETNTNTTR